MSLVFFPAEYSTIPLFLFAMALPLIHSALHPLFHADCGFLLLFFYVCQTYTKKSAFSSPGAACAKKFPEHPRNYSFNV